MTRRRNLTQPESDAILAALRHLADSLNGRPDLTGVHAILTNAGLHKGMTPAAIHKFADSLAFSELLIAEA
jgi:hypothetical protein